jgi:hypothetical protein
MSKPCERCGKPNRSLFDTCHKCRKYFRNVSKPNFVAKHGKPACLFYANDIPELVKLFKYVRFNKSELSDSLVRRLQSIGIVFHEV